MEEVPMPISYEALLLALAAIERQYEGDARPLTTRIRTEVNDPSIQLLLGEIVVRLSHIESLLAKDAAETPAGDEQPRLIVIEHVRKARTQLDETFGSATVEHPIERGEHDLRLDPVGADEPAVHRQRTLEPIDEPLPARDTRRPARELPRIGIGDRNATNADPPSDPTRTSGRKGEDSGHSTTV
jgi:hypothetical protein